jgi:hypothetical protein
MMPNSKAARLSLIPAALLLAGLAGLARLAGAPSTPAGEAGRPASEAPWQVLTATRLGVYDFNMFAAFSIAKLTISPWGRPDAFGCQNRQWEPNGSGQGRPAPIGFWICQRSKTCLQPGLEHCPDSSLPHL